MDGATPSTRGGLPEPLGKILSRYMRQSGLLRRRAQRQMAGAWCQAVGEEVARHTRIVGFRRNVLEVAVDSAPRLQELANFEKAAILLRLREVLGPACVRDIRFRPGPLTWEGSGEP